MNGVVTPLRTCGSTGGSVAKVMKKISYSGYRFPPEIIHQAIWLYLRFTAGPWRSGLSKSEPMALMARRGAERSARTVARRSPKS